MMIYVFDNNDVDDHDYDNTYTIYKLASKRRVLI